MSLTKATYSMISGAVANVLDFGADSTGATSSTAAFTAAIATGNSVFVPAGSYKTGVLNLTTQGQQIFGEGDISIIQQETAGAHLFYLKADYITVRDLRLNGIESTTTNSNFAFFTAPATPAKYATINNVVISGSAAGVGFNNAIKFDDDCDFNTVTNCVINRLYGNTSGTGYGVLCAGNKCYIAHNTFQGAVGRGRHAVYISSGGSDNIVLANYVENYDYEAITQFSQGAQPACARNIYADNIVLDCAFSGNVTSGGIGVYGHTADALISNNIVSGSRSKGIVVDGTGVTDATRTVISGNIVNYSSNIGIDIISGVGGSIVGNKVYESSTDAIGTYSNIRLVSDNITATTNFLIEGNCSSGLTYARSAFQLNSSAPAPAYLTVTANKFDVCQGGVSVELGGVPCAIDGRYMFRANSVSYGPIANNACVNATYTVPGAVEGGICTVSHTGSGTGVVMYATVSATDTVTVVVLNVSGAPNTIASGTLRIDVWQRPPSFL